MANEEKVTNLKTKLEKKTLRINSRNIVLGLFLFLALLIILSLAGQYLRVFTYYEEAWGLIPLVYMGRSLSVPTIYMVMLLFLAAVLLVIIASIQNNKNGYPKHWAFLALAFVFLSLDAGSRVNILFFNPLRNLLRDLLPGLRISRWHVTLATSLVILIVFFRGFYKALPKRIGRLMLLSLALYLTGFAVYRLTNSYYLDYYDESTYMYAVLMTIKKSLEISSAITFIHSLLSYLKMKFPSVMVNVEKNSSTKK